MPDLDACLTKLLPLVELGIDGSARTAVSLQVDIDRAKADLAAMRHAAFRLVHEPSAEQRRAAMADLRARLAVATDEERAELRTRLAHEFRGAFDKVVFGRRSIRVVYILMELRPVQRADASGPTELKRVSRALVSFEKRPQLFGERGGMLGLALPDDQHRPPSFRQRLAVGLVPDLIALQLRPPVVQPALRLAGPPATFVLVPEAAVHEDRLPPAHERDVRFARKVLPVQPVAVACSAQDLPNQ